VSVEHACWQFLMLGAGIEVLEPPELCERMRSEARAVVAL
jgi:hypothetical protein